MEGREQRGDEEEVLSFPLTESVMRKASALGAAATAVDEEKLATEGSELLSKATAGREVEEARRAALRDPTALILATLRIFPVFRPTTTAKSSNN